MSKLSSLKVKQQQTLGSPSPKRGAAVREKRPRSEDSDEVEGLLQVSATSLVMDSLGSVDHLLRT